MNIITYMAPSIPKKIYEILAEQLSTFLDEECTLSCITTHSGPPRNQPDPFSLGKADLGFMCAPPYIWLTEKSESSVDLVPFAPVFDDPRNKGRPIYFSDVIVRNDNPAEGFEDLRNTVWSYNDTESLSGYFCLFDKLHQLGEDRSFFKDIVCSGSHLQSIRRIIKGEVDCTAIDSNVLLFALQQNKDLKNKIKIIGQFGPYGIQPIVMNSKLPREIKKKITQFFKTFDADLLKKYMILGFSPVKKEDYDKERVMLKATQHL